MRKYKKEELCDCIYTLKEATRKMNLSSAEARAEILPQCQEMAIAVGTTIEQLEGEGTKAVSYLEEYCEELYLASGAEDQASWKASSKRMEKLLNSIQNSIRYDLPDSPSEIVFMPYKASMWDALDSVYRASIQGENCHVVVMPIPYNNINRKDQQLDLHYEGNLFPADIPITDYRMYDLAKERPDVIFIHNPYDEYNYVTRVPEEYFSSKLVEYTDHLVYIPYFVTRGDKVKDIYCNLPAVQNAWRTFVQSKDVRSCYLENGASSEKIVAMGSPKFDMVINLQKNPPEMPDEWKGALSGRKIFLLNTHLNPLINEAEKVIDKLRQIFELFRHREDASLLWRPHPLSIETAKAMNPGILSSYLQLVKEFKSLSNGVYDESSDVHRAIAISDAYVGDWSSLVTLYGFTGKPIYILNINADTNIMITEKNKYLQFACGAIRGSELWAVSSDHNGLYKIDMNTFSMDFVTSFDKEGMYGRDLYHRIVVYGDDLYLIPWVANYIGVYHIKTGMKEYIAPDYEKRLGLLKFSEAIPYKNYLYLFPARVSSIIQLNMDNGKLKYFSKCCKELENIDWNYATFLNGSQIGNKAWIVSRKANCFVVFDLESESYEICYLNSSKSSLADMTGDIENLYILTVLGEVIQRNIFTGAETLLWEYKGKVEEGPFCRIICKGKNLWLLPGIEDRVVNISLDNNLSVHEYELPIEFNVWDNTQSKTIDYVVYRNSVIACPIQSNQMIHITDEGTVFCEKAYENDLTGYYAYKGEGKNNIGCHWYYSEFVYPLERFLNIIISDGDRLGRESEKYYKNIQCNSDGNCGEKIWQYIQKNI